MNPRGDVESAFSILRHAIRTTCFCPVVDEITALRRDTPIVTKIEAPKFAGSAAAVIVVVCDVEEFVIGGNEDAVRSIHLMGDDARDRAIEIDSINTFDWLARIIDDLPVSAWAVAGISEIEAPFRVDGNIVRGREPFALVGIGKHGDLSIEVMAGDPTLLGFADEEVAVMVEEEPVRTDVGFEHAGAAARAQLVDVTSAAREET